MGQPELTPIVASRKKRLSITEQGENGGYNQEGNFIGSLVDAVRVFSVAGGRCVCLPEGYAGKTRQYYLYQ